MIQDRRDFLKSFGSTVAGVSLLASGAQAHNQDDQMTNSSQTDVDQNLQFLNRNEGALPRSIDYFSSIYSVSFRAIDINISNSKAIFFVQHYQDSKASGQGGEIEFEILEKDSKLHFQARDSEYYFFWKPKFGIYTVDAKNQNRPIEMCQPMDGSTLYQSNQKVTVPLKAKDSMIAGWTRMMYWTEGITPSPLAGFEGFCEETLQLDSSERRDEITAKGLSRIINTIPLGVAGFKILGKSSPQSAVRVLQSIIPRVFGWMMGATENIEEGKILIHDCPYRKRLGTYPCESTCGHAIGKYFTKDIGIPLRFNPSAQNYQKCEILIGEGKV